LSRLEGNWDGGEMMFHAREWKEVLLTYMGVHGGSGGCHGRRRASMTHLLWNTNWKHPGVELTELGRPAVMNGGDGYGGGGAPWGCWTGTSTVSSTGVLNRELDRGAGWGA
jgi:hypothetical protein